MTKIRWAASHTFHRTPHVRDKETSSEVQGERGKLKPLIRRLKNMTDFHLQAFTLKQRVDNAVTTLQAIHQTSKHDQEATQIMARHSKKTLDQAAAGTWALWHDS
jgi:regulator of RNase E activity RraA